MSSKNCILLFARTPQMGIGKSRLSKDLGYEKTFTIYENMLKILAKVLSPFSFHVIYHNDNEDLEAIVRLKSLFNRAKGFEEQVEGDLGCKIKTALETFLDRGFEKLIVLGSDTPHISNQELLMSFQLLDNHDYVLGPANDGGYWLLGLKEKIVPEIFEKMKWGSDRVFYDTYSRLLSQNKEVSLINKKIDLDTSEDFQKIVKESPSLFDQEIVNILKHE